MKCHPYYAMTSPACSGKLNAGRYEASRRRTGSPSTWGQVNACLSSRRQCQYSLQFFCFLVIMTRDTVYSTVTRRASWFTHITSIGLGWVGLGMIGLEAYH